MAHAPYASLWHAGPSIGYPEVLRGSAAVRRSTRQDSSDIFPSLNHRTLFRDVPSGARSRYSGMHRVIRREYFRPA